MKFSKDLIYYKMPQMRLRQHRKQYLLKNPMEKEVAMPIYCMLTTLTDRGRKTIRENPDRIKEVNKEIEYMGVKIIDQYALLGQYDFVNIVEAPNNEVIAKLSVELSARGTIQTLTLAAMPLDNFVDYLKKKPSESPW